MATFQYTGLTAEGRETFGEIEAANKRDVARMLQQQSIFVVEVREAVGGGRLESKESRSGLKGVLGGFSLRSFSKVKPDDVIFFFRQMSLMLRAGHTVVQALDIGVNLAGKPKLAQALQRMSQAIQGGNSFHAAMALENKVFPPMVAHLVASGEASGELDTVLERLATNLEREQDLKRQMSTAMIYPSIVIIAAIGVVYGLMTSIVPKLAGLLTSRDIELPAITVFMIDTSNWFVDYGTYLLIAIASGIFGVLVMSTFETGKAILDRILLNLPVFGYTAILSNMAQVGSMMGLLIKSGLTVLEALRVMEKVIQNKTLSDSIKKTGEGILAGKSLSAAMEQKHIPPLLRHMAAVGEQGGQLDTVMEEIGDFYVKRLEVRAKKMVSMIEPALILVVGGIVGTVYLAMFMAILKATAG